MHFNLIANPSTQDCRGCLSFQMLAFFLATLSSAAFSVVRGVCLGVASTAFMYDANTDGRLGPFCTVSRYCGISGPTCGPSLTANSSGESFCGSAESAADCGTGAPGRDVSLHGLPRLCTFYSARVYGNLELLPVRITPASVLRKPPHNGTYLAPRILPES